MDRVTAYFSRMQALTQDPDALDFTFGNPHEMALRGLTDAMRAQLEPRSVDWYAYKTNERPAQEAVAAGTPRRTRPRLRAGRHRDDSGGVRRDRAGARAGRRRLAMRSSSPCPGGSATSPMLHAANLVPVPAALDPMDFSLDIDAIARAITPADARGDRELSVEPHRQGLPRQTWDELAIVLEARIPQTRAPDLAAVRRAVSAHPLRRHRVRQPGRAPTPGR